MATNLIKNINNCLLKECTYKLTITNINVLLNLVYMACTFSGYVRD